MFLDSAAFPFVQMLEANWEVIRAEYLSIPPETFDPWVQQSMHGTGWSVYGMVAGGYELPGGCRQCPRTAEILREIGNVGLAGFSRMAPGTHIAAHSGWAAKEYRLHLGLVVPEGCRIRVAEETRNWEAGKVLIFDDTVEHEAWNDSDKLRGNLMLDFLRPGETEFSLSGVPADVRDYAERLLRDDPS